MDKILISNNFRVILIAKCSHCPSHNVEEGWLARCHHPSWNEYGREIEDEEMESFPSWCPLSTPEQFCRGEEGE